MKESETKYTNEDLQLLKIFTVFGNVEVKDLIKDDKFNRIFVVVKKGDMGKAVGKNGWLVNSARKVAGKDVIVVEYSDNLEEFVMGLIGNVSKAEVKESEGQGGKVLILQVPQEEKGLVIGARGQNIEKIKLLTKKYFNVSRVLVS